jgi:DNA polymerase III subunit gamma/tau
MEYRALYREYRPGTFDEVIGQKHIVAALRNSVRNKKIAHAYLFCGTRGTGKTSLARIFSRAVNCLDLKDGNPCNECSVCTGILSERLLDVIEIDAASNNSVDNIRDIRDEVVYLPAEARHKVYIIDEAHMLSAGAFNALLKTLEEPPDHVIFILATTEPQKLPATILSRCQRYDFKRIPQDDICGKLSAICSDLGVQAEDKALRLISKVADGAMRDAISILDKCISAADGMLTYSDIFALTGISDTGVFSAIIEDIMSGNIEDIIGQLDAVEKSGADLKHFVSEMVGYLRDLLVCCLADDPSGLILADDDVISTIEKLAGEIGKETILRLIEKTSELNREIKWIQKPKIFIEVALIDMAVKNSGRDFEKTDGNYTGEQLTGKNDPVRNDVVWSETVKKLQDEGKRLIATYLAGTVLLSKDKTYTIVFNSTDALKKKTIEKSENLECIKGILAQLLETEDISLKCDLEKSGQKGSDSGFSDSEVMSFFKDVPIDIVDD